MSFIPAPLIPGSPIEDAPKVHYTSSDVFTLIGKLTLVNLTNTLQIVNVYLVPDGETASAQFGFVYDVPPAGSLPVECTEVEGHVLGPGGTIQASCLTNSAVALTASGYVFA